MTKQIVYKGLGLAKGSTALELWEAWQKDKSSERNKIQKKLDDHIKDCHARHRELLARYPSKLSDFAYAGLLAFYASKKLPVPQWVEDEHK